MSTRRGGGQMGGMQADRRASPAVRAARRRFLGQAAAAVAASVPLAAWARLAPGSRSVSLAHAHTNERLSITYFRDGNYVRDALAQLDFLLRDFRTGEVHPIDPALLDILHDLRLRTGHAAPFAVVSGYRSPRTNAELRRHSRGVAEHSLHMQGRAIDIRLPGYATRGLQQIALDLRRGGVGYYPAADFVHVDTGRVRAW